MLGVPLEELLGLWGIDTKEVFRETPGILRRPVWKEVFGETPGMLGFPLEGFLEE